jgi:glycosyltransferase involved in cell wall biosynthesis
MKLRALGIDVERLTGRRTGVARYISALLREWAQMELPFERVLLFSPSRLEAETLPARHPYSVCVPGPGRPRAAWAHWTLARAAREVDALFCPSYVVPLAYRGASVVTIHDAIHEVMPATFSRRSLWTRRPLYRFSARRADLVLTDSQASKRDLERAYGLSAEQVVAIPLGVDSAFRKVTGADEERVRKRYGLGTSGVVLFVGKFSRRRNLPTLVRAFAELRRAHDPDVLLVLAGDDHLGLELADLAEGLGIGGSVHIVGHVPDEDLPALYATSTMLAYPSDHEGFGLPVVEAMAAGTAVITLDNSALREVADDAALLLPAATVDGLAEAMWRLLRDRPFREELVRRGKTRAQRFSWSETARRTMTALAQVGAGEGSGFVGG